MKKPHAIFEITLFGITFLLLAAGCTSSQDSGALQSSSIINSIAETGTMGSKEAQLQIQDLQKSFNLNPQLALTSEEQSFLLSNNIIQDETNLKGWVR